jgi:outer membrane protein OmpA-like peptidoglycan-associated protein
MNRFNRSFAKIAVSAFIALAVSACGPSMVRPEGADDARTRLSRLQSDTDLAGLAPIAIREAEAAVRAAEEPRKDQDYARHLVAIADRKVDKAWALAEARHLEDQRKLLSEQTERMRLDARTREADRARRDASVARSQAELARQDAMNSRMTAEQALVEKQRAAERAEAARADAQSARSDASSARTEAELARSDAQSARSAAEIAASERQAAEQQAAAARAQEQQARQNAEAARADADAARQKNEELRQRIAELDAKATERGLIVTLGDVLFETAKADLKGGASANLGKLARFLNEYSERSVIIEGHTDNVGREDYNLGLSQRRADSVRNFLIAQGVAASRISATGMGEAVPVADNGSSTGRQQNRRVEVIISND